ncbi:MAG: hypothetical protein IPJ03_22230 [Ignavibacteriales bacterium]|nr:hypothetical protein [Ignavibacteriales bacterium]
MKYLKIKSQGVIERGALALLGASTKREDESKIGQFGSGNKYALAYLLRNNYKVSIYSGMDEVKIITKKESFRENEFDVIYIDGEKTSITTQLGKDWELWQAIRELYSNAIDEGGQSIGIVEHINPKAEETHFYLEINDSLNEFIRNFDNYFAENRKVLFESSIGKIFEKADTGGSIIYRRGIRCSNWTKQSLYDYDIPSIDIDEARLLKYFWNVESSIWKLIFSCTDKTVIKNILMNGYKSDNVETSLSDYCNIDASHLSNEFKECLAGCQLVPLGLSGLLSIEELQKCYIVPTKVFKALSPYLDGENINEKFKVSDGNIFYKEIVPNKLQELTLQKAKDFFKETSFEINYPIAVALLDNKKVLGAAHNGSIILSDICVEEGVNEVVNTIIEEYIHLKYGVADETRAFQTAAISEMITYMKKQNSYIL